MKLSKNITKEQIERLSNPELRDLYEQIIEVSRKDPNSLEFYKLYNIINDESWKRLLKDAEVPRP